MLLWIAENPAKNDHTQLFAIEHKLSYNCNIRSLSKNNINK